MTTETFDSYQALAAATIPPNRSQKELLLQMALGMASEAGEVAGIIEKHVAQGHKLDYTELFRELGDVLWYVAGMSTAIHMRLTDIACINLDKLHSRYRKGFTTEESVNRARITKPDSPSAIAKNEGEHGKDEKAAVVPQSSES